MSVICCIEGGDLPPPPSQSFIFLNNKICRRRRRAISFPQPQYYAFTESEFNEAEREIGGLITLIIMRGCDLLNCKVHLNPSANYGMCCGGVSGGVVKMGSSR